jgi:DNA modification methylase
MTAKEKSPLRNRITGEGTEAPDQLLANPHNWRRHPKSQSDALEGLLKDVGWVQRVIVNQRTGHIVDGHLRVELALRRSEPMVPVLYVDLTDDEERKVLAVIDPIGGLAETDQDMLDALLTDVTTDEPGLQALLDTLAGIEDEPKNLGSLAEQFGMPPFSVLNAREGAWQNRKALWNARIGDKGESREETLFNKSAIMEGLPTVSILDATLAEIMVKWFARPGYAALDPFAGDTVFGFVAATLGLDFTGIELRKEQADLNNDRVMKAGLPARYINDTSANMDEHIPDESVDFVFSCPPYADLEVYSDDPRDLSTMSTEQFMHEYSEILGKTFSKLRPNRFACIVTSEVRGTFGEYIGLVPGTIKAMQDAGYRYWNELILITMLSSLPKRAAIPMHTSRKTGRTHQNVLVFYKGDEAEAKKELAESGFIEPAHAKVLVFYKGNEGKIKDEFGPVAAPFDLGEDEDGARHGDE